MGYCCSYICIIKFTNKEFRIPTKKIPDLLYNQRSDEDYFLDNFSLIIDSMFWVILKFTPRLSNSNAISWHLTIILNELAKKFPILHGHISNGSIPML